MVISQSYKKMTFCKKAKAYLLLVLAVVVAVVVIVVVIVLGVVKDEFFYDNAYDKG